jgi:hypothetical protein
MFSAPRRCVLSHFGVLVDLLQSRSIKIQSRSSRGSLDSRVEDCCGFKEVYRAKLNQPKELAWGGGEQKAILINFQLKR